MTQQARREALKTLVLGSAALATGCAHGGATEPTTTPMPVTEGSNMTTPAAFSAQRTPVPLPFDPRALNGLSERMIVSHHENNYGGAVKNLNAVEKQLASVTKDTPPFLVAALHERELTFRNSKTLHEAYFGNLGGDGRRAGAIDAALASAYGASSQWEEHFRALGTGLGGGSGWALLSYELDTGELRTCWSGGHTQVLATSIPLLVMDMYEHAYQIDFGAATARYIDAFFANVRWDEVNARFERAARLRAAWSEKAA